MVRLRLRFPHGQQTADVSTYPELAAIINAGMAGQDWCLLTGYPPSPMASTPGTEEPLGNYIKSGETVVVKPVGAAPLEPKAAPPEISDPAPSSSVQPAFRPPLAPPPPAVAAPPPQSAFAASAFASADGAVPTAFAASARSGDVDEEEQLRIALALSLGESVDVAVPPSSSAATAAPPQVVPSGNGGVASDGERLIRRVVPADNSCLFAAIAHAFEGSAGRRERADGLRKVVAEAVLANPVEYSEAMLGKPPSEYVEWILSPSNWGGGIEVAILADHYQSEIAAFDVQTQRVDVFGQGKGRERRVYLLYDGVHYDLIVKQLFDGAPEDCDVTVFDASDDAATMNEARMLVSEQHKARKFTDTGSFTLRCLVCQRGLVGQEGAMAHAKETGHSNFCEYK